MTLIWIDDFESTTGATSDISVTRNASEHVDTANGTYESTGDYSFLTDGLRGDGSGTPLSNPFSGAQGTLYWRAEDIDGIAGLPNFTDARDVIEWTGIDISGQTELSFSGLFAARSSNNPFDPTDFVRVEVSIDGGAYQTVIRLESENATGGPPNTRLLVDTDNDGVGDGTVITDAFQTLSGDIAGTGALLDLRLTFEVDATGEEIGFDNFQIGSNDIPVVSTVEAFARVYAEHGGPQSISDTVTLTDANDTNLTGAVIAITAGYDAANDSLAFTSANGITVASNTGGVLTLTGTATVAQYQAAIRAVTYENAFTTESIATRTFSISVSDDGGGTSVVATRDMTYNTTETITGSGATDDILEGDFGVDVLIGLDGNDFLVGGDGNDTLLGGDGNDGLRGGEGADILNGGAGIDRAIYAQAPAGVVVDFADPSLNTGDAAGDSYVDVENILGSAFADTLSGDANANGINGGAENDIIVGRGGDDRLFGGSGNDVVSGDAGVDYVNGGSGMDTLNGGDDNDRLEGSSGNDILNGDAGNDLLRGGADNDTLNGGLGRDSLIGGSGDDELNGGDNNDNLHGSSGIDTLNGDAGNDRLYGGDDNDTLNGGDGADILSGGTGTNSLFGNAGNDTFDGGAGIDAYDGGTGTDRVYYNDSTAAILLDMEDVAATAGDAAGDTFTSIENVYGTAFNDGISGNADDNRLSGMDGDDMLYGRDGNDKLFGGDGEDLLFGENNDDLLVGGADNDELYGGFGDDKLYGDAGDDVLEGGLGDDVLIGGAGADEFTALGLHGTNKVIDFEDGVDKIVYVGGPEGFADLTITKVGGNTHVTTAEGVFYLSGIDIADVTEADFEFIGLVGGPGGGEFGAPLSDKAGVADALAAQASVQTPAQDDSGAFDSSVAVFDIFDAGV